MDLYFWTLICLHILLERRKTTNLCIYIWGPVLSLFLTTFNPIFFPATTTNLFMSLRHFILVSLATNLVLINYWLKILFKKDFTLLLHHQAKFWKETNGDLKRNKWWITSICQSYRRYGESTVMLVKVSMTQKYNNTSYHSKN